ncbi:aldose epimerase family protein [Variovorax sp. J22R133]|uniref:aldose epimerase family protein n=1 Tax=Variovorax brevis TaxID=3053503 RepID=UPI002576632E|nr:aldose epimerase family protein [Variovorax sp. J22R133]MDM0114526.1 aldose epimerase family protein [Variovorax sp. J22R133]
MTLALARIEQRDVGQLADGRLVREFTLHGASGIRLSAINLGGIVTALHVPDRDGQLANVVLGCASLQDYETRNPHFGTIVGRYGNRIAHGRFSIEGREVQLEVNDGRNALHGGFKGFGKRWWDIEPVAIAADGSVAIELRYTSEDGEGGYPGRLDARVRYTLTAQNEWRIDYHATCDQSTIVNLTHHDYFNLRGSGDVLDHMLTIGASRYCPVDDTLIPEGIAPVEGTPFDFREARRIGERIRQSHVQLLRGRGYDHNFVLDEADPKALHFAARLEDPVSGRTMDVLTTEPGVQFYSGNFLDGTLVNSAGQAVRQGDGLCLETQHFPDSPNQPSFPSTVLVPGQVFASTTVHRFGLMRPR